MSFHWNHRVVKFVDAEYGDEWLSIQEVYYNMDGKPRGCGDPSTMSESLDGLKEVVARMQEALTQPVLTDEDFESTDNEEDEE